MGGLKNPWLTYFLFVYCSINLKNKGYVKK